MTKSTYASENLRIIHIKENAIIKHAFKDAGLCFMILKSRGNQ